MDDSVKALIPVIVACIGVVVAILGYFAKYTNDLAIARRNDRLGRVNRQLSDLYGPLYALFYAGGETFHEFFRAYSSDPQSFWGGVGPSPEQAQAWRLWMTNVFQPLNRSMVDTFISHADLLEGSTIPVGLLKLVAHVKSYDALLKRWEAEDFSDHVALIPYPRDELEGHITSTFNLLKQRQAQLLGEKPAGPQFAESGGE